MWGKEWNEGGKKKAGLEWNLFQLSSEFKTVTLPFHWIILKMDIISHFFFFFFGGGVIWKPQLQDSVWQAVRLSYNILFPMEQKKFLDGHTVTDFLTLLHTSEKSERAFIFVHSKVSETYTYNFNTDICIAVNYNKFY